MTAKQTSLYLLRYKQSRHSDVVSGSRGAVGQWRRYLSGAKTDAGIYQHSSIAPPAPSVAQVGEINGDGYPDLFVLQEDAPVCTSQECGPIINYQFELFLGKGAMAH